MITVMLPRESVTLGPGTVVKKPSGYKGPQEAEGGRLCNPR